MKKIEELFFHLDYVWLIEVDWPNVIWDKIISYLIFGLTYIYIGYVWFPENLKENVRERKYKGKVEGKKKWRKIKK